MLRFTHKAENVLHYEVHGWLSAEDLRAYYATIDAHYRRYGKLKLLVQVRGFSGYAGLRALLVFTFHEPGLLRKVKRYAAVAEQAWFRRLIHGLNLLLPGVPKHVYYAAGFGGNFIVVDEQRDLVIVTRWLEPSKIGAFVRRVYGVFE